MRKDYDSHMSSTQKNTYELRNVNSELRELNKRIARTDEHVDSEINSIITKFGENSNGLQQQIIDERK